MVDKERSICRIVLLLGFMLLAVQAYFGWNLVRVRNIVVAAIFDFMTVEDWGE